MVTRDFGHFFKVLDAACAGQGVALVPTLFLRGLSSASDLVYPFESTVPSAGEYYLLCREEAAAMVGRGDQRAGQAEDPYQLKHSSSLPCEGRGTNPKET